MLHYITSREYKTFDIMSLTYACFYNSSMLFSEFTRSEVRSRIRVQVMVVLHEAAFVFPWYHYFYHFDLIGYYTLCSYVLPRCCYEPSPLPEWCSHR